MEAQDVFVNVEVLRYAATFAAVALLIGVFLLAGELGVYRPLRRMIQGRHATIDTLLTQAVELVNDPTDPLVVKLAQWTGLTPQQLIAAAPPVLRAVADALDLALKYTEPPAPMPDGTRQEVIGVAVSVNAAADQAVG